MPSIENQMKQANECIEHKINVLKAGQMLVQKLFQQGEDQFARKLLKNLFNHDNSKTSDIEFMGMADDPIVNYPNTSEKKFQAIINHWTLNPHHPEYWIQWKEQPKTLIPDEPYTIPSEFADNPIHIAEMCCDWYSRTIQYNTDIMDFWKNEAPKRWKFDNKTIDLIEKYLNMLIS